MIIVLIGAFTVTTSLILYGLYENSQGVTGLSVDNITATHNNND